MASAKNKSTKIVDTIALTEQMTDFPEEAVEEVTHAGISLTVKKAITIVEVFQLVDGVVESCFGDTGYHPEVKELAIRSGIMKYYADISLPEDLRTQYSLISRANSLYEKITHAIDATHLAEVKGVIEAAIKYRMKYILSSATLQNEALHDRWERLAVEMNELFEGISSESMKRMINTISDGKLDEEKLVNAILAAKQGDGA